MGFVENTKYDILTPYGWCDFSGINKKGADKLFNIKSGEDFVTATTNHTFYVDGEKKKVCDLVPNIDKIDGCSNSISNISYDRTDDVFDVINVNNEKNMFLVNRCHHTKNCMDEFAFVPKAVADAFWAANYPTISASIDAKIIIISTPCGVFNSFHLLYTRAERKENEFVSFKSTWRDVPGRDNNWAREQIRNLGETRFSQEFEGDFLGSTNTVIVPSVLEYLFTQYIEPEIKEMEEKFRIYKKPEKGAIYVLGCDCSKGTGEDFSVVQVLRINSFSPLIYEQVAVFEDNFTDVYSFADIINRISIYYNNAYIMVENNAEGAAVVNKLWWDIETENLVNTGNKAANLGIRATRNTKPKAVLLMKKLIEDNCIILRDKNTIEQLASYVEKNGKYFGKDLHDDTVSALYWASYVSQMDIFDEEITLKSPFAVDEDKSEEEIWGILADIVDDAENSMNWVTDYNIKG